MIVGIHRANLLANADKDRYGIGGQVRPQLRYEALPVEVVVWCIQGNRCASGASVMIGELYAIDACLKDTGEFS